MIAAARLGGLAQATSEEFEPNAEQNVIYIMDGQQGKQSTGGTMRLGNYPDVLKNYSRVSQLYGVTEVTERHRHRYEVNQKFVQAVKKGGLVVSGTSPDGDLVEFVEAPDCAYFVATQAHPEFKSRPFRSHPLFAGLVQAALVRRQ